MKAFVQGWRRKIGCGLLILACALIAPWTYSYSLVVAVEVPRPYLQHAIESRSGHLLWTAYPVSKSRWKFAWYSSDDPRHGHDPFEDEALGTREWTIPYWSLILPLTAISAGLILWGIRGGGRQPITSPRPGFFHSWQRKAGGVTLAIACGLLFMWVRSSMVATIIDINNSQSLFSENGTLHWVIDDGLEGNPSIIHHWFDSLKSQREPRFEPRFAYLWRQRWQHGGNALSWGYDTTGTIGVHWLQIQYWIVVPLLLCLSGWLILRARREPAMITTDTNQ